MKGFLYFLSIFFMFGALGGFSEGEKFIATILLISGIILFILAAKRSKKGKSEVATDANPEPISPDPEPPSVTHEPESEASVKCPKCGSTQFQANKKGYGAGKALGGALLTGGIGLLAGFIGSKKLKLTCLKCGYQWKPGQG